MTGFTGFTEAPHASIEVPDAFFSVILPQIESITELKVTLHLFWLLAQRTGTPKAVSLQELESDATLLRSLKQGVSPRPAEDFLREGLELAATRGTIVVLAIGKAAHALQRWYLLNTQASREAVAHLAQDQSDVTTLLGPQVGPVEVVRVYRPNIYTLYERNIGVLTPLIADQLREAELLYPPEWLAEAMKLAVEYNKRNWRYIAKILKRWESEGKSSGSNWSYSQTSPDSTKYTTGRYGHLVES